MSSNGVALTVLNAALTFNGPRKAATAAVSHVRLCVGRWLNDRCGTLEINQLQTESLAYLRTTMCWQRSHLTDEDINLLVVGQMTQDQVLTFNAMARKVKKLRIGDCIN